MLPGQKYEGDQEDNLVAVELCAGPIDHPHQLEEPIGSHKQQVQQQGLVQFIANTVTEVQEQVTAHPVILRLIGPIAVHQH